MTVSLAPAPVFQGVGFGGQPLPGGKLFTYISGTSTPQATYTDSTQLTQNTNPVILNANGQANVWLVINLTYKLILQDFFGNQIWSVDNIPGGISLNLTQQTLGQILYPQTAIEIAQNITPAFFNYPPGDVRRYGAKDDNSTDNISSIPSIIILAQAGMQMYWPVVSTGIYKTSTPLLFTSPPHMQGDPGTRIKLIAPAGYVMQWDSSGGGTGISHGGFLQDFILDGGGFNADGLYLKNIVSANFYRIRSTNLLGAGIHLSWAQSCYFDTPTCSNNVEVFGAIPAYGCLIDNASGGGPSSDNTFVNPCWEQMRLSTGAGVGCKAQYAINSIFLNGTSEGNKIGIIIGDLAAASGIGNSIIGMDMEANLTADLQILGGGGGGYGNDVIGGKLSSANSIFITGGVSNHIIGGFSGGVTLDSASSHNTIQGMSLLGASATITDAGTLNSWDGSYSVSNNTTVTQFPIRRRTNYVLNTTGNVAIDCSVTSLAALSFVGAGASTITINVPSNPTDSIDLEVCLHVGGAGTLTLSWAVAVGGFKLPSGGVTVPGNGFNRTYRFRYDPNFGFFYLVCQTASDVAN